MSSSRECYSPALRQRTREQPLCPGGASASLQRCGSVPGSSPCVLAVWKLSSHGGGQLGGGGMSTWRYRLSAVVWRLYAASSTRGNGFFPRTGLIPLHYESLLATTQGGPTSDAPAETGAFFCPQNGFFHPIAGAFGALALLCACLRVSHTSQSSPADRCGWCRIAEASPH